jgi:hypothetical protein
MTTTLTKDPVAASGIELQLMHTTRDAECLGLLPAPILHIAAQFTSKDEAKQVLQLVNVRSKADGDIVIESTDGHRAFRFVIPRGDLWHLVPSEIKLSAETLRKRVAYGHWAVLRSSETIDFMGGKKSVANCPPCVFLESRPYAHRATCYTFPAMDNLWPDKFSNEPQAPIAYNAGYLADFLGQVAKFSPNGVVTMETNKPSTPLVFTATCDLHGLEHCRFEYLLMPVQLRN